MFSVETGYLTISESDCFRNANGSDDDTLCAPVTVGNSGDLFEACVL